MALRFRNSGSYYAPFNVAFMSMFNSAQKLKERDSRDTNSEFNYSGEMSE